MTEITYRPIEGGPDHIVVGIPAKRPSGGHKIDIVTAGIAKLIYLDGKRLHQVTDVDLPLSGGDLCPSIGLRLWADQVNVRKVNDAEYKALLEKDELP